MGPTRTAQAIYLARRAAVVSVLVGSGVSEERAEALVSAREAGAEGRGIPRLERTFWEGATQWTSRRAHPNKRA